MKTWIYLATVGFVTYLSHVAYAGHGCCPQCGCAEGCYDEVINYRCVTVPDVKPIKKVIYHCQEVPFCEHRLPKPGHCADCLECKACPKYKKVLFKKEIICGETCGTKCVVESFVQLVPKACCHCGHLPCATDIPSMPDEAPVPPIFLNEPPMGPSIQTDEAPVPPSRKVAYRLPLVPKVSVSK